MNQTLRKTVIDRLRPPAESRAELVRDVHKDVVIDVLCESEGRTVEILGRERRRRWAEAEKLEILAAVNAPGETLAHVARRYDVSRS